MKIGGRLKKMCCWSLLTSHGSGSREVGWLSALRCLITWILVFHSSPQLTPRMERDSGWGGERRREGSGEGNGGWMVVWWEDQTHCHSEKKRKKKKKKLPLHPPHPEHPHPNHLCPPPHLCFTGRVKPLPTGSGSFVPASSGRCWGSSFDGLLTSHQPSGCRCWWETEAEVRLMLPHTVNRLPSYPPCICLSVFLSEPWRKTTLHNTMKTKQNIRT